jgi:serine/threonine protein kinase
MSLGGGSNGNVVLIQTRRSMKTFALKELKPKEAEKFKQKFKQEVDAMRGFEHDCVLPLIDANLEQNFIIVEYCPGGTCLDLDRPQYNLVRGLNSNCTATWQDRCKCTSSHTRRMLARVQWILGCRWTWYTHLVFRKHAR